MTPTQRVKRSHKSKGVLTVQRRPVAERLWLHVAMAGPDECWLWQGSTASRGYGRIAVWLDEENRWTDRVVHRVAYELMVGPVPDGMVLDHLCRVRSCVNPAHLEVVTTRQNVLRGTGPSAVLAARTHCKRGHSLSGDNLIVRKDGGRGCRRCRVLWDAQARERRRAS